MELLHLFEHDKYQEFCLNYKQGSIPVDKFHREVEKNIPYIEFILREQKDNYDLAYIEYLAANHRSDVAIKFFESIKYIKDDSELHNCSRLLEIICDNKDIELFKYVSTYPVAKLSKFDYQVKLFNVFFREGFKEALELVASKLPNPHLFLIDNILTKGCVLTRQEFLSLDVDYNFISHPEALMSILVEYYDSPYICQHREKVRAYEGLDKEQMLNSDPASIMSSAVNASIATGKPVMSADKLKAFISKKKLQFNFKVDKVAALIWNRHTLECALQEKNSPFKREIKI